jgi:hypothetical protein
VSEDEKKTEFPVDREAIYSEIKKGLNSLRPKTDDVAEPKAGEHQDAEKR